jgi:hypothetical protein
MAALASGESHPSWWTYASPEATALVGIHWETVRDSPFGDAIGGELSADGSLRFPDLACLREAQQVVVSSPALLAVLSGNFPAAQLREQALRARMKVASYRGVALWIHPAKDTLSVAMIGEQLLLVGGRRALESAIDRVDPGAPEGARPANRRYSPLLARAARFAQSSDLWVVATRLPDPLASLFVPIDVEGSGFEGSLSLRGGLHVEALLDAGSVEGARTATANLRGSIPSLPAIARRLQVAATEGSVVLALDVSAEELAAGLRGSSAVTTAGPVESVTAAPNPIVAAPVAPVESPATAPAPMVAASVAAAPTPMAAVPPKPEAPQIIRILGLDEGPREIVLPPVRKQP